MGMVSGAQVVAVVGGSESTMEVSVEKGEGRPGTTVSAEPSGVTIGKGGAAFLAAMVVCEKPS